MQLRYYLSVSFFLLMDSLCYRQFSVRKHIDLVDDWKFHFGHAVRPSKDFNYSVATIFSKSGFFVVNLQNNIFFAIPQSKIK